MYTPSRRQILRIAGRTLCGASAAGALGRLGMVNAYAQGSSYKALVCVFLFGGNDSNNTVVPINTTKNSYTDYSNVRKAAAIAQSSLLSVNAGSETYGLHPSMTAVRDIYNAGKVALLTNVGTLSEPMNKAQYLAKSVRIPSNLFSHSDQQGQWQTADTSGFGTTGWAGRVADIVGPAYNVPPSGAFAPFPTAISLAGSNIMEVGEDSSPATVNSGSVSTLANFPATPNARTTAFLNLLNFDNGVKLVGAANGVTQAGINDASGLNAALNASTFNPTFPNTTLGNQLKMVSRIINVHANLGASRQIFFVSMGGFDNHDKLLNDQNTNLGQVSAALGAFAGALQDLSLTDNVTVFTESDFSRTNQPNTSVGSDHAWGGHHLILGGAVKGGVYGAFPTLALNGADDVTGRGVYLPTTSLDQYGATLAKWFGVSDADMPKVFPNLHKFAATDLGFLG
ncbi:MAG: DUF1501 domain-containing protein [Bryobacteraceae bacterium]